MPTPEDGHRRVWLSRWKEWAIEQLPESASAAIRSRTRLEVEHALTRLGTQDAENEIRDLVEATLDPILLELANRDANATNARQKQKYLEQAEAYLEIALVLMASARTTTMLNRPEYARPVLAERLRHRVRRLLTGAESHTEVLEQTIEFLDRSLAEQPLPPREWGQRLAKGTFVTTMVAGKLLKQIPELRELVDMGLTATGTKLGAILARHVAARKPPPSTPTS
jgi:hypothetical protein